MRDARQFVELVCERDVDMLLLEEMHASSDFISWLSDRLNISEPATFKGAWHSVIDARYGETDLFLRIDTASARFGIHFENKIAAPEMPSQDTRYLIRGQQGVEAKQYDKFLTCIVAPSAYLKGLTANSAYNARISYEDITAWFSEQRDSRSRWREYVLTQAISQARRGYVVRPDASTTAFQFEYWKHVCTNHPKLVMKRPGDKGSQASWPYLKTPGMKPRVHLIHKTESGVVDLSFQGWQADQLAKRIPDRDPDMVIIQTGKSAVVRIHVDPIDRFSPFQDQVQKVETALSAALRLSVYYDRMQSEAKS